MRDRLMGFLGAVLDVVLTPPTHVLCWALSWLGVLDGDSRYARPSFAKLVIAGMAALESYSLVLRARQPGWAGPTVPDALIIVCLLAAALGRKYFAAALEKLAFQMSAAWQWTGGLTAQMTGDVAAAIKALREHSHEREDGVEHDADPSHR